MSEFTSAREYFESKQDQPIFTITAGEIYETLHDWYKDDPTQFKDPNSLTQAEIDDLLEKLGNFYFGLCFSGSKLDDWAFILEHSGIMVPATKENLVNV